MPRRWPAVYLEVRVLEPGDANGIGYDPETVWNYEIGQPVQSSPAVVDGAFIVGCDDGSVYCFGGK